MRRKKIKIVGSRGDWTARVAGKRLAVIHNTWRKNLIDYFDPMTSAAIDGIRYQTFVEALKTYNEVVIQVDAAPGDFSRVGYVGVFSFSDLIIGEDGSIALKIVDRLYDPA